MSQTNTFQIELEFVNVVFLEGLENRMARTKTSGSREENQRETQPTYGVDAGARSQATFGGRQMLSRHCIITAPLPPIHPIDKDRLGGDSGR